MGCSGTPDGDNQPEGDQQVPDGDNQSEGDQMIRRSRVIGVVAVVVGVLAPASVAAASQYVDLGDSYASGVGTRVFYSESGSCKRSPEAYGPKVAAARGY